jgi:hypothetical protein
MRKLLILSVLCVVSCAAANRGGGLYQDSSRSFSVVIPRGWERVDNEKNLLITKDGPFSQYILVQDFKIDKRFKHTHRRFQKDMLPQEASEVIVDEIASDNAIRNFKLVENMPTTINSYDGFRLVFSYNTADDAHNQTVYYGFLIGDMFYSIRYNTCRQANYQEDAVSFQEVLNSFKVIHARVM